MHSRRRVVIAWACNECKKRKGRCSGDQPCQFCSKSRRICEYDDKPTRTALTRRNLDRVEARCIALEKALRKAKPALDIEQLVKDDLDLTDEPTLSPQPRKGRSGSTESYADLAYHSDDNETGTDADGMVLVSAGAPRIGFLGETSASGLLASIERILKTSPDDGGDQDVRQEEASKVLHDGNAQDIRRITPQQRQAFVDAYFMHYNSAYPLINESEFRKMNGPQYALTFSGVGGIICSMVLALGAFVGSTAQGDEDLLFYVEARSKLSLRILDDPSIALVQALVLMGNYVQKRDQLNTGYVFIGLACRTGLALGLHRQLDSGATEPSERSTEQMRRRVFWTLFNVEAGFAFTVGRPPTIDLRYVTIPLPANTNETSASAHLIETASQFGLEGPTQCSCLIQHAKLSLISNRLHCGPLMANADPEMAFSLTKLFEKELDDWLHCLPSYFFAENVESWFKGTRTVLLWREHNIRITMFKSILSHEQDGQVRKQQQTPEMNKYVVQSKCLDVSLDTVNSIYEFAKDDAACVRGVTWYGMYFVIRAILTIDLAWLQGARLLDQAQFELIRQRAEIALLKFSETNPSANRFLKFLKRIETHHSLFVEARASELEEEQQQGQHQVEPHLNMEALVSPGNLAVSNDGSDAFAFDQSMWMDPSFNSLLDDPFVATVFDDFVFFPT